MKKVTCGMCLLASAMFAAAVAYAQQAGAGAGSTAGAGSAAGTAAGSAQDARQGQGTIQENMPSQQQSGINAAQNQLNQPGAPREQSGQLLQPQQPGIETRQNVVTPENRFGQQRGFNFQSGAADPMPTPAERQAQGFDAEMQTRGQVGQNGAAADGRRGQYGMRGEGQRGELGVWLAVSGGPGVEIRRVTEGSAAAEIGLQPGDMLLQINGQAVSSPIEVQQLIRAIPAGQTAMLEIWRNGNQQEVSVTLQPARENYRSGYRGDEMPAPSGNLESRTMRLEEQLSMVMRELQQLRADITRMHPESTGQATGAEMERRATQPQQSPFDRIGTPQPAEEAEPATLPERSATEPKPAVTEPAEPATEPAEDLFGEEPAATETEATPPAETETETETQTEEEAETDTDSLFE